MSLGSLSDMRLAQVSFLRLNSGHYKMRFWSKFGKAISYAFKNEGEGGKLVPFYISKPKN
jgi:hypothetical protein